ncbi:MAG: hypothetical protein ACRC3B_17585, partial [Bacteroidia bacterium]
PQSLVFELTTFCQVEHTQFLRERQDFDTVSQKQGRDSSRPNKAFKNKNAISIFRDSVFSF